MVSLRGSLENSRTSRPREGVLCEKQSNSKPVREEKDSKY